MMSRIRHTRNGLAVDIPAELVDALGLAAGDDVDLHAGVNGSIDISGAPVVSRASQDLNERAGILQKLRKFRGSIPADYRFSRDEANER